MFCLCGEVASHRTGCLQWADVTYCSIKSTEMILAAMIITCKSPHSKTDLLFIIGLCVVEELVPPGLFSLFFQLHRVYISSSSSLDKHDYCS